jgi:hypothetical protein
MKKILVRAGFVLAVVATTGGIAAQAGSSAGMASPNTKQYCC